MSTPVTVEIHEPAGAPRMYSTCPSTRRLTLFTHGDAGKDSAMTIDIQCSMVASHPGRPHSANLGAARVQWSTEDWMAQWYAPLTKPSDTSDEDARRSSPPDGGTQAEVQS